MMRFNTFELLVGSYIYVNKPALTFHLLDHSFLLLNAIFVFKESSILTYFQKWIGNQKRKRSQETLNDESDVTLKRVKAARGPHSYNLFCAEFFKTGEEKTKIYFLQSNLCITALYIVLTLCIMVTRQLFEI